MLETKNIRNNDTGYLENGKYKDIISAPYFHLHITFTPHQPTLTHSQTHTHSHIGAEAPTGLMQAGTRLYHHSAINNFNRLSLRTVTSEHSM